MRRSLFPLVILALAGLAFLDINRLLLHIHEYVPIGFTTDYYHFHWNYWWIREALTHGWDVYNTDYILYALGSVQLGVHTLTPLWFPLWAILEPLFGHIVAMNSVIWFTLVLSGTWMFILLKDYTHNTALAFAGAAFVMLLPYFGRAAELNHVNLTPFVHYPLSLWLWRKIVKTRDWRWAVALGFEFWFCWLTDTMWLLYIPVFLAAYGLYTLFQAADWGQRRQLVMLGLVSVILFAGLSWFIAPWQQFISFDRSEVSPAGRDAAERWSINPSVYLLQPDPIERGRSLGRAFTLLIVASLFLPARGQPKERWFWLAWSFVPMILTWGTDIVLFGQKIDMPYLILHEAQGGLFRTPERFLPIFVVCGVIFLAITWQPYVEQWRSSKRTWVFSLLILLTLADLRVYRPADMGLPIPPYDFHQKMAAEENNYVLLEIPVTMSSGWTEVYGSPETHFYILTHHKKIINGHASRLPDFAHYYYTHETVWGWLANREAFKADTESTLRGYIQDYPIGYIMAYQRLMGLDQDWTHDLIGYLNGFEFICPLTVERDAVIYLTEAHPNGYDCPPRRLPEIAPQTWQIQFGLIGDEIFIGRGFHRQELVGGLPLRWIGAKELGEAYFFIDLPPADYTLRLEAFAFHQAQTLQVLANGENIGEIRVESEGLQSFSLEIPAALLGAEGKLKLELLYEQALIGAEMGLSSDPRPLVIALSRATFEQK